ncbi:MAG: hypothetical protein M0Z46_13270 [Actinomycetota bacterium]|jgi:hypothetical protein|nr:hypothetical protein [Actinomycetota bacterium]
MSNWHQTWLVALRELRERSRSSTFRVSMVIMTLTVIAMLVVPAILGGNWPRDVSITVPLQASLPQRSGRRLVPSGPPFASTTSARWSPARGPCETSG